MSDPLQYFERRDPTSAVISLHKVQSAERFLLCERRQNLPHNLTEMYSIEKAIWTHLPDIIIISYMVIQNGIGSEPNPPIENKAFGFSYMNICNQYRHENSERINRY